VEIDAPATDVWKVLEDVRRLPEFSDSTVEVTNAPDRITAVGQTYTQVGKLLGRTYSSTWTVRDLQPGRQLSSEGTIGAGVRYCLTQHLRDLGDGHSRLDIDIDYSVPGGALGRLAAKAGVESRAGKEAQAVLDGIKSVVERGSR
jgi:uncharacterized membrane protein